MSFSPAGKLTGSLISVANLGCEAADYPSTVAGAIALVSRGTCNFAVKVVLAKAAGALGVVVYNNVADGVVQGTLGEAGDYVPAVGITQADGLALAALTMPLSAMMEVILTDVLTYNVIAQTKGGDSNNVLHLGAHSDSVEAGTPIFPFYFTNYPLSINITDKPRPRNQRQWIRQHWNPRSCSPTCQVLHQERGSLLMVVWRGGRSPGRNALRQ